MSTIGIFDLKNPTTMYDLTARPTFCQSFASGTAIDNIASKINHNNGKNNRN